MNINKVLDSGLR